ncbi:hypothetical protein SAMN05660350_00010 [Geodermatophilus obscurus]|uniref:Uncharacterized protein n=1 Tax=Geodermatophilus obscurus TaxID=1861 RepID=A0A1M7RR86_9ACTN|nr:hypothetical protein SAMN05660350_00010 [Geodermatophilus obscurus]
MPPSAAGEVCGARGLRPPGSRTMSGPEPAIRVTSDRPTVGRSRRRVLEVWRCARPRQVRCRCRTAGTRPRPHDPAEHRRAVSRRADRSSHSALPVDIQAPDEEPSVAGVARIRAANQSMVGGFHHRDIPATEPRPSRRRPRKLFADRGYDTYRRQLAGSRHHPAHRPPRRRPRLRPGLAALGRRTRLRLAARLQATTHPLRAPRRHPPRATSAGLRPDLLSTANWRHETSSEAEKTLHQLVWSRRAQTRVMASRASAVMVVAVRS